MPSSSAPAPSPAAAAAAAAAAPPGVGCVPSPDWKKVKKMRPSCARSVHFLCVCVHCVCARACATRVCEEQQASKDLGGQGCRQRWRPVPPVPTWAPLPPPAHTHTHSPPLPPTPLSLPHTAPHPQQRWRPARPGPTRAPRRASPPSPGARRERARPLQVRAQGWPGMHVATPVHRCTSIGHGLLFA